MAKALSALGCEGKELSVLLTDDARILRINEYYRGIKSPTNVLSFPQLEDHGPRFADHMLGDVVVSVDTAAREAVEQECSLELMVYRLLCHGLLHLLGYDHEKTEKDAAIFFRLEESLARLQDFHAQDSPKTDGNE